MHSLWRRANAAAMTHKVPVGRRPVQLDMTPPEPLKPAPYPYVGDYWFIAYVQPNCEERVIDRAEAIGLELWAPMKTEWRYDGEKRKRTRQHRPLFPRYVFAATEMARWGDLLRISGVGAVLGLDGRPWPVSESLVRDLSARQQRGEFDTTAPAKASGRVQIIAGPLAGFSAWLDAIVPKTETGQVRITMLGKEQTVTLPLAVLKRA